MTDTQKAQLLEAVAQHKDKHNSNRFQQRAAAIFGIAPGSREACAIERAAHVADGMDFAFINADEQLFAMTDAALQEGVRHRAQFRKPRPKYR